MRALSDKEALGRIVGQRLETTMAELARDWRWSASKVKRRLANWSSAGHIEVKPGLSGRTVIKVPEQVVASAPAGGDVATIATLPEPVASAPARRTVVTSVVPESAAAIIREPDDAPEADAAT